MIRKKDYFRLGVFILLGVGMLVSMVIILGAGSYFETTYSVETYFDESINGLAVGSPVKLRGVDVGRVTEINFTSNFYNGTTNGEDRYVYVACAINPRLFGDIPEEEFQEGIKAAVKRGMRMRPTSLGLTGQLFLNTVYVDPGSNPPPHISWTPEHTYIPSVPSTLSRVEAAVTTISKTLSSLKQEDLESIIEDVKSIVDTIDNFMRSEGGKEAGSRLLDIMGKTRNILARTDELLADPAAARIIPETAGAITSINHIATESADNIIAAADEAQQAIRSFREASEVLSKTLSDPRMDQAMGEIAPTLENISQASKDMTAAVAKVHALVNRLNGMVASEESNVHSIIEDTREVMQNMKELTGDAKRYPSGVIFGTPPEPPQTQAK